MAAPRNAAPTPNIAPFIVVGAIIIGIGASLLRLPGALVAWALLIVAAWMSTPPQLTGKKDAAGYPTVGNPGEGKKLRGHQRWVSARWKLFGSVDWLPNDPRKLTEQLEGATTVLGKLKAAALWALVPQSLIAWTAIGAAVAVFTFPVDQLAIIGAAPDSASWLMWPNAIAMYGVVRQMDASARQFAAPSDPQPAIDLRSLMRAVAAKGISPAVPYVAGGLSVVGGFAVTTVLLNGFNIAWLISPWQATAVGVGVVTASLVLSKLALPDAHEDWQKTVAAREVWGSRWQTLKVDPAPYLTSHREFAVDGALPVLVDTFDAPAHIGAEGIIALLPKMAPAMGGGYSVMALNEPDVDSQGQPMPGTKSPIKMTVVAWPADTSMNALDPGLDQEAFEVLLRAAASHEIATAAHLPQAMLLGVERITVDDEGKPAAWRTRWMPSADPGGTLGFAAAQIGAMFRTESVPDSKEGAIYLGALTSGESEFAEPGIDVRLLQLSREAEWRSRWTNVLKQGEQQPYIQHAVYAERKLATGEDIYSQPFMMPQGLMSEMFMNEVKEKSLSSTLNNAPFVSVQRWDGNSDRGGERHHGAFRVVWSPNPITTSPARVKPAPARGRDATTWVLAAAVMSGFDAAKLARPEVVAATALTGRTSELTIWDIQLRLYGSVTLASVKQNVDKIRNGMGGVEWLRITASPDGCRIVAGAKPADVQFARREHKDFCTALDWEQAFTDAKVITTSGQVPSMVSAESLPKNPKVQRLIFRMPPGLDRSAVRNAKRTLMPATGNIYLEDEAGPTPDTVALIVCPEQPVPFPAPFDWDEVASSTGIPFASGVTGEPIVYDWKLDPHVLMLGGTGSGKAQPLDALIPVPVSERFPTGWARNEDLAIGDEVFGQHGERNAITGFSDERTEPVYVVTFDDGQEVRTSGHHLWRVWDADSRKAAAPSRTVVRDAAAARRLHEANRLDELAVSLPPASGSTAPVIAQMAGIDYGELFQSGVLTDALARKVLITTGKRADVYAFDDLLPYLDQTIARKGQVTFAGTTMTRADVDDLALDGSWLSARSLADAFLGRPSNRAERALAKQLARRAGARRRPGTERRLATAYPADEVLRLLARRHRSLASRHAGPSETVMHTADMLSRGVHTRRGAARYAVEVPAAIGGPDADLPIAPYTLGAWLGDGGAYKGGITSADDEVFAAIEADGFAFHRTEESSIRGAAVTRYSHELTRRIRLVYGVTPRQRADKRIPSDYLRASATQRLELLQGLMDTDGTISAAGACELTLCKADLAADALELVRSLGIKASMAEGPAAITEGGVRRVTGTRYRINFTTNQRVFRLARKADRLPASTRITTRRLYVTGIRVEQEVPQRCLRVANADHLYLTGGFVSTHNSASLQNLIAGALIRGCDVFIADPTKGAADFQFAAPWSRAIAVTDGEASAMMDHVYAEVVRRKNVNAQHGVASYTDLPEAIRPPHIIVFIDEFTSLMFTEQLAKLPSSATEEEQRLHAENELSNANRRNIGGKSGRLVREARSAGVTLVLAGQELKSDTLAKIPGGTSLKGNTSSILLGKSTFGSRMSALKDAVAAPELGDNVPKGRGLFESSASSAQVIQSWFDAPDHVGSLVAHIAAVREPLADVDRVELGEMVRTVDSGPVFGRRIDGEAEEAADGDDEVVEVAWDGGEIDLGVIDIDLSDMFDDDDDDGITPVAGDDHEAILELPTPLPPAGVERSTVVLYGPGIDDELAPDDGVDVESLPEGAVATGHPLIDAMLSYLIARDGVSRLEWVSPAALDVDASGATLHELLEQAAAMFGIDVVHVPTPSPGPAAELFPTPVQLPAPPAAIPEVPAAAPALPPAVTIPAPPVIDVPPPPAIADDDMFGVPRRVIPADERF